MAQDLQVAPTQIAGHPAAALPGADEPRARLGDGALIDRVSSIASGIPVRSFVEAWGNSASSDCCHGAGAGRVA